MLTNFSGHEERKNQIERYRCNEILYILFSTGLERICKVHDALTQTVKSVNDTDELINIIFYISQKWRRKKI